MGMMKRAVAELVTRACLITAGDHVEMPEADELPVSPEMKKWNDEMPDLDVHLGFPLHIDGAADRYYDLRPDISLREVLRRWADDGRSANDDSMPQPYSAKELWPLREFTWTRETARDGNAKVGGKTVDLPGPLKWDAMVVDLKANGWDTNDPLHFHVGKNGKMKVAEGNHRLAIAKQINLSKIPVRVHFNQSVKKGPPPKREPVVELKPKQVKKAIKKPAKPPTPEEQKQVDDLMNLLGF
jgi:hypothetical protein